MASQPPATPTPTLTLTHSLIDSFKLTVGRKEGGGGCCIGQGLLSFLPPSHSLTVSGLTVTALTHSLTHSLSPPHSAAAELQRRSLGRSVSQLVRSSVRSSIRRRSFLRSFVPPFLRSFVPSFVPSSVVVRFVTTAAAFVAVACCVCVSVTGCSGGLEYIR